MTQREIAEKLQVTQATVSMALKGSPQVSASMRAAVLEMAQSLGYRPNLAGQMLRKRRSNVVGAVFPSLTNSFMAELFQELQRQAVERGYLLSLATVQDAKSLADTREYLRQMRVAGLMTVGSLVREMMPLAEEGVPLVFYATREMEVDACQVVSDQYRAGSEVAHFLVERGFRHAAHFAFGTDETPRCRGFCDTLAAAGMPPKVLREWAPDSDYMNVGVSMTRKMLAEHPEVEAVFCHNDEMAVGVYQAARELGLDLPGQLSVVGFDDLRIGRYLSPGLTTVEQPRAELSRMLLDELSAVMESPERRVRATLPCRLIVRASVR